MQRSSDAATIHAAFSLIRRGRFLEALAVLEPLKPQRGSKDTHVLLLPVFADVLQRLGFNDRAEEIASRNLASTSRAPEITARYYFVLGNVYRERGDLRNAITQLTLAADLAASDLELSCWVRLRLIATVAELSGIQTALSHIVSVKRALARFGDARPFAAFHIWLAEIEGTRGNATNARRHLARASSLLAQVEDVWLQGYLAINSSAVSYYCADIGEAKHWAERAIAHAEASGHRGTRRAANANLGHIELSEGNLSKAELHFQTALECCEEGTVSQIAVLDSIAQAKLQGGDLAGCGIVLQRLRSLRTPGDETKLRYYETWALQTRIQLLLRTGDIEQARTLIREVSPLWNEAPQARVSTVSYLVAAETLIAAGDEDRAVHMLAAVLAPQVRLPPDLFAHTEYVTAHIFSKSNANLARTHLDRSIQTFDAIGHRVGRSNAAHGFERLGFVGSEDAASWTRRTLDRVRALMDLRGRPKLFGREAVSLLHELECAGNVILKGDGDYNPTLLPDAGQHNNVRSFHIPIQVNKTEKANVALDFDARDDPSSIVTALEFRRVIEQILAIDPSETQLDNLDDAWTTTDSFSTEGLVFASESMLGVLDTVRRVAPTDIAILITGETGVGKEIIARSIHEQSLRVASPFVALNCAAVPKELLESQLFGYRRGAFSGAAEAFQGVVRAANGGTLFLDEIAELPLEAQAKLLRFLELGEIHPIGEALPCKVNVRMLFATNEDLQNAVRDRRFREDLFYRLNVIAVRIPPLRERREEIPPLVNAFATKFARELSKEPPKFTGTTMELLILHSWPGNVRQLSNEVRRITALSHPGAMVTPEQLSPEIAIHAREMAGDCLGSPQVTLNLGQTLAQATDHLERMMIEHALRNAQGRVTDAAAALGLSRKGLYLKRRRLGMLDGDGKTLPS